MSHKKTLSVGCLVMAAGNAARFGENKLTARLDGVSLIRRTFEAIPRERFAAVTVVTQYLDVAELASEFGFSVVWNHRPELGISHTIRLGTEAMGDCDGILYLVGDQPLLRRQTVVQVLDRWLEEPDCIVGAAHEGKRGNPNLFPKQLFPALLALEGDRGGSRVIRQHPDLLRLVEAAAEELADCDTREALQALKK